MTPRTIVLIEDDQDTRDSLEELLRFEGYEVRAFENGKLALEGLARGLACQLIVLDWRMPQMAGLDFMAERKRIGGQMADVPVLVFSADASVQLGTDLLKHEVLPKPAHAETLLAVVARLTGAQRE